MITQQDYEGKKIIFMGLDNSGKTSITKSLMGVKNITSFCSTTPTRIVDKKRFRKLNTDFSIWDFGGQEQLRKDYLSNFANYIKGTDKLIYVIDIQDVNRYDEALEYLIAIVKLLEKIENQIEFSIFFHKYDPDLLDSNEKLTEEFINTYISKLVKEIPSTFKYNLFRTSIYTIFKKSKI